MLPKFIPVFNASLSFILATAAHAQCPVAASLQTETRACSVRLTWQLDPTSGPVFNWSVFRAPTSNPSATITLASPPGNSNVFDDTTAVAGTNYLYYIRPTPATPACTVTPAILGPVPGVRLLAVQNLTITPRCDGIRVGWDPLPDTIVYQVARSEPGNPTPVNLPGNAATSLIDTTAVVGTQYTYIVSALTTCGPTTFNPAVQGSRIVPATLGTQPVGVVAQTGQTLTIPFNFSPGSQTTVTFSKDGQPVPPSAGVSFGPSSIQIVGAKVRDSGLYQAQIVSTCGTLTQSQVVAVRNPCPGDFDESGGGPQVGDIFAFLSAWFAGCP